MVIETEQPKRVLTEMFYHSSPTNTDRRFTVCGIINGDTINIGASLCSPKDNFNKKLGRKIARGRATSKPIMSIKIDPALGPGKTFLQFCVEGHTIFLTPENISPRILP
jgi:hypothetical protein